MNKRNYIGKTLAYKRFNIALWKTESLLELGVVGINDKVEEGYTDLLEKFVDVKGIPGPKPKKHEPKIESKKTEDGKIELSLDARTAQFLKNLLEEDKKRHDELRFFLYSNIFISVWGALETYSQMLFEELLSKKPEMLKSNEVMLIKDVVSNRASIIEYLVERQVEAIGHFSVDELISYYKKKVNYSASAAQSKKMKDYYFVRNVIAHKSGIIRESQRSKLPAGVKVIKDEIQISEVFLRRTIKDMKNFVKNIEMTIEEKFYKKT
ncbi:MAG: hypothetical protein L3J98_11245 [Gammaproteobacteria bacterium]|nr:hypothetical protein [Gammaproteobacteria bacterium]